MANPAVVTDEQIEAVAQAIENDPGTRFLQIGAHSAVSLARAALAALSAHKPGELTEAQAWNVLWMDGGTQCHRIFSNENDAFEWAACLPIKFPGCSNGEVVELVPRQ